MESVSEALRVDVGVAEEFTFIINPGTMVAHQAKVADSTSKLVVLSQDGLDYKFACGAFDGDLFLADHVDCKFRLCQRSPCIKLASHVYSKRSH